MTPGDALQVLNSAPFAFHIPAVGEELVAERPAGLVFAQEGLTYPDFTQWWEDRGPAQQAAITPKGQTVYARDRSHMATYSASFRFVEIGALTVFKDYFLGGPFKGPFAKIGLLSTRWPKAGLTIFVRGPDSKKVLAALEVLCPNLLR
jgi:hypothetical protein